MLTNLYFVTRDVLILLDVELRFLPDLINHQASRRRSRERKNNYKHF
jgi:hypothetical protein